jgi:hypothetical protein
MGVRPSIIRNTGGLACLNDLVIGLQSFYGRFSHAERNGAGGLGERL